jgi:PAS domain S-box-containing protein
MELWARGKHARILCAFAPDPLAAVSWEGRILEHNPALSRRLGFGDRRLIGRRLEDLVHPDDRPALLGLLRELVERASNQVALRVVGLDGRVRRTRFEVHAPADERVWVLVGRGRAEPEAEDDDGALSHALGTPLTAISVALRLLESGLGDELPPRALELVGLARRNCERLARAVAEVVTQWRPPAARALARRALVRGACTSRG